MLLVVVARCIEWTLSANQNALILSQPMRMYHSANQNALLPSFIFVFNFCARSCVCSFFFLDPKSVFHFLASTRVCVFACVRVSVCACVQLFVEMPVIWLKPARMDMEVGWASVIVLPVSTNHHARAHTHSHRI